MGRQSVASKSTYFLRAHSTLPGANGRLSHLATRTSGMATKVIKGRVSLDLLPSDKATQNIVHNLVVSQAVEDQPSTAMHRTMSLQEDATMVCGECFRAKGACDPKPPCRNPKCYFYNNLPAPSAQLESEVNSLSLSLANDLTFSKAIGCDRAKQRPSYSADILLSSSQKDSVWGYHPASVAVTTSSRYLQLPSSSVFASGEQKIRSQSISESRRSVSAYEAKKSMRSRMMSMPGCVEPLLDENDLVEDAFLSSPLPDLGGEEVREDSSGV